MQSQRPGPPHLLDHLQHIRLQLLCPVGAHTQVELVGVLGRLERFADTKDGVRGCHLHACKLG